ncbi:MAG: recombinase family protein [Bacteroidota bacterium]
MHLYHFDFNGLTLFGYARKSTTQDERQVASIPSQEKYIFGEQHNGTKFDIPTDRYFKEQCSAKKKDKRTAFYDLLAAIRQAAKEGKRCGIVSWDTSRLSRNPSDSAEIIEMVYQEQVLECIFTFGRIFTNLESPETLSNEFARHHAYIHKLGKDVKRGLNDKVERGWYPAALLPAGYKHNPFLHSREFRFGTDDEIIIDQPIFTKLAKLDQAMLTGNYSIEDIRRLAAEKGLTNPRTGKPYTTKFFCDFFRNPFYHEGFTWNDQYYADAKHQKLRTGKEYDRIQLLLIMKGRQTNKAKENRYNHLYNAIFACACGAGMTTDHKQQVICTVCQKKGRKCKFSIKTSQVCPKCKTPVSKMKNPSVIDKKYLRCNSKKCTYGRPSVNVEDIETQIEQALQSLEIKHGFAALMRKHLQTQHLWESNAHKSILKSKRDRLATLEGEVSELVGLKIAKEVSEQHYAEHKARLETAINNQKKEIVIVEEKISDWHERMLLLLNFGEHAARTWKNSSEFRRSLLLLFDTRIRITEKKIHIDFPETLFMIKGFDEDFEARQEWPEPKKNPYSTTPFEALGQNLSNGSITRPEPKNSLKNKGFEANSDLSYLGRRVVQEARTSILSESGNDLFYENLRNSTLFGLESFLAE